MQLLAFAGTDDEFFLRDVDRAFSPDFDCYRHDDSKPKPTEGKV